MKIYFMRKSSEKLYIYDKEYRFRDFVFYYGINTAFNIVKQYKGPNSIRENPYEGYQFFCGEIYSIKLDTNHIFYKVSKIKEITIDDATKVKVELENRSLYEEEVFEEEKTNENLFQNIEI